MSKKRSCYINLVSDSNHNAVIIVIPIIGKTKLRNTKYLL
ncbi:hypothetical protein VIBNISO65_1340050 [Vibrio nigripulchritudo SO65]|nr:hypothetical protein VIBNIPon4_450049 [Vibrio nigripulchritudo POn4]CCN75320.1 hypothetical protein VIBNISO65_1340050 [Vibrio nigripulchritudo SO65]